MPLFRLRKQGDHMRYAGLCGRVLALAVLTGLMAGCLETETPLAPPEQGVIDAHFIGDWKLTGDGAKAIDMTVRNFNGHEFYVEMREPDKAPVRYAAHVTVVKGAAFANVRELTDDETIEKKYVL